MTAQPKAAHLHARADLDWYVEPKLATAKLLQKERFTGTIWDPCCGMGNIPEALADYGYEANWIYGSDIVSRIEGKPDRWTWFGEMAYAGPATLPLQCDNIVSNPPFHKGKGTEDFIRFACEHVGYHGKVAVFTDVKFLAGAKRATGLWRDYPPTRVWIITPRPSCPPGEYLKAGNKAGGGTADWCWLVWSRDHPHTGTTLGWIT